MINGKNFYNCLNFQNKCIDCIEECREVVLNIYNKYDINNEKFIGIIKKNDDSPLTIADKKCNEVIMNFLNKINNEIIYYNPDISIGIISEENKNDDYEIRQKYEYMWLVDPLDGTKEFIKKNGNFTINIGLVHNGVPVFGIVSIPCSDEIYIGIKGDASYYLKHRNHPKRIKKQIKIQNFKEIKNPKIVASSSHMSEETLDFIKLFDNYELINVGSSIKLLYVAHDKADIYPRLSGTYEWDTCAAHCVVKYAGGNVIDYETNKELVYNKKNLLNPWFIVF